MATYHVATTGDNGADGSSSTPWADPDYAVSQVSAGDIVIVHEGLYDVRVTLDASGSDGSPIVFVNAPGEGRWQTRGFVHSADYVWVIGAEVWHDDTTYSRGVVMSGSHNRYEDFYFHHTYNQAIYRAFTAGSNYNVFRRGSLHYIGSPSTDGTDGNLASGLNVPSAPIGIAYSDHWLFEYIECDKSGDFIEMPNCQYIIVRNIYDHDFADSYFSDATPNAYHRDSAQPESVDEATEPTANLVFEAVLAKDNIENNSHGYFTREYYNDVATHQIVRGNLFHNHGSGAMTAGGTHYWHAYHNTVDRVNQKFLTSGTAIYILPDTGGFDPVGDSLRNNIISNSGSSSAQALSYTGTNGLDEDGNLVYNTPNGDITPDSTSDPAYDDDSNDDLHIGSGSPAVDLALAITTITTATGSGMSFDVADASRFCDGFGIAEGDLITVGASSTLVRITDISTNTVTVDASVSWTLGDGVYWQGRKDAGAWDYAASYAIDVALADPVDSDTVSGASKTITLSLTNAAAIRQVQLLVDNIPVDLKYDSLDSYSYDLDLSGYSNGDSIRIEARAFPLAASQTLYASDVATVTMSSGGGGGGTVTFEGYSGPTYEDDSADQVLTLNKPTGTAEGDLLVAQLGNDDILSHGNWNSGLPSGWIMAINSFGSIGAIQMAVAIKVAGASEPATYDFSYSDTRSTVLEGAIFKISGFNASNVINASDTAETGVDSTTCPDVTTDVDGCLILRLFTADDDLCSDDGSPADHTVVFVGTSAIGGGISIGAAYQTQASAGATGTAQFTGFAAYRYASAATIAIEPGGTTTYTVTYDGNTNDSGTAPTDASSPYEESATVTVLDNTGSLAKTGYRFVGWNTAANGSGTDYVADATFAMPASNVTLYAQWIETFTVAYDENSGTGSVTDESSPYDTGSTVTVLDPAIDGDIARTGYRFIEWNTAANGSGTAYDPDDTFAIAGDTTLYAQWSEEFNVTYDGNTADSGDVPTDATDYIEGETVTAATNTGSLVKSGYTLSSWNTAANGTGTSVALGGSFAMEGNDVTLYAQWTEIGTGTDEPHTAANASAMLLGML